MPDDSGRLWHFRYGETYDDLRTAFYVDPRAYGSWVEAERAAESAADELTKLGVVFEIERLSIEDISVAGARPGWEEFRSRGVPIPVRPTVTSAPPPSWDAMMVEVAAAHERFRASIVTLAEAAFPGCGVWIRYEQGPRRITPGSVDRSEEGYGFDVNLGVQIGDRAPEEVLAALDAALMRDGWRTARGPAGALTALRDGFGIGTSIVPGRLTIVGKSPLYRSRPAPETTWSVEPRL